ncbi:hypothetical protein CRG98_017737 [Punica granatum]|uniref:Uncharacterized protein n=1 Tax=Punica granatum TaxID=22663 RepID=A0A2I0JZU7_PUNGR|nr:hypothetical protein CRG98_017737 [Punica granatum]
MGSMVPAYSPLCIVSSGACMRHMFGGGQPGHGVPGCLPGPGLGPDPCPFSARSFSSVLQPLDYST